MAFICSNLDLTRQEASAGLGFLWHYRLRFQPVVSGKASLHPCPAARGRNLTLEQVEVVQLSLFEEFPDDAFPAFRPRVDRYRFQRVHLNPSRLIVAAATMLTATSMKAVSRLT